MATEPADTEPARCGHWHGDEKRHCGRVDGVKPYLFGLRCGDHTPARLAGRPEVPTTGRPWWIREDGTHLPLPPLPAVPKGRDKPKPRHQTATPTTNPAQEQKPNKPTGPPCCGEKPPGQTGQPVVNACQLCPHSPTYWRKH